MPEIQAKLADLLCSILDNISRGELQEAETLIDKLKDSDGSSEICKITDALDMFKKQLQEGLKFAGALSQGDLHYEAPRNFYLFSDFKQLQANLRHLTWQTQQIAKGDYGQSINFIGEFSAAFNKMTEGLKAAKKIQDDLNDLYATRNKFFSIISHDLRSPFNAILGFSDILADEWDDLSDTERRNFLQNIRNTAHNTFDLLEHLLEWSRIQTGKMKFSPVFLDINKLADETMILLNPSAGRKQIRLLLDNTGEKYAWADKEAILLVLRNLISNAIKFTAHGGTVRVSALNMKDHLIITISDTGVGIAAGNIKKLFRFEEQLKTEGTDHEKGSGLGLVLCREIVEKSGGRIWAESTEGKGSRFSFTLPLQHLTT